MCGYSEGDLGQYQRSRKVRLTISRISEAAEGATDQAENLRMLCVICKQGLRHAVLPAKPRLSEVLAGLARASSDDQFLVLRWLQGRYGKT